MIERAPVLLEHGAATERYSAEKYTVGLEYIPAFHSANGHRYQDPVEKKFLPGPPDKVVKCDTIVFQDEILSTPARSQASQSRFFISVCALRYRCLGE